MPEGDFDPLKAPVHRELFQTYNPPTHLTYGKSEDSLESMVTYGHIPHTQYAVAVKEATPSLDVELEAGLRRKRRLKNDQLYWWGKTKRFIAIHIRSILKYSNDGKNIRPLFSLTYYF